MIPPGNAIPDLQLSMTAGDVFGPIAILAMLSVLGGLAVIVAAAVRERRLGRKPKPIAD